MAETTNNRKVRKAVLLKVNGSSLRQEGQVRRYQDSAVIAATL